LPFTGETELDLPCWAGELPTATAGLLDAIAGGEGFFLFAAVACNRAVGCAGTAAKGDVVPVEEEVAFGPVCAAVVLLTAGAAVLLIELCARAIGDAMWRMRC